MRLACLTALLLLAAPGVAKAETTVDLSPSRDCYILSSSASTSYCSATTIKVGSTSSRRNRLLLHFNVAGAIPSGNVVKSARLYLYVTARSTVSSVPVEARRVTRAWTTAASWNKHSAAGSWSTPGGDFAGVDGTSSIGGSASTWVQWDLTAAVTQWQQGSANNGLLLKQAIEGSPANEVSIASMEAGQTSRRPYLRVTYEPATSTDPSPSDLIFQGTQDAGDWSPDIYRADANGTSIKRLVNGDGSVCDPILSASGLYFAYMTKCGLSDGQLAVSRIDGSERRILATGSFDLEGFSPDGRHILVSQFSPSPARIKKVDFATGQVTTLPISLPPGLPQAVDASYAPDGQRIAVSAHTDSASAQNSALVVANADGSNPRKITSEAGLGARSPQWSPDGRQLVFVRIVLGTGLSAVATVDADGSNLTQVASQTFPGLDLDWGPDGNIAYGGTSSGQPERVSGGALVPTYYVGPFSYREGTLGAGALAAAKFRPNLYFDSSERWRPLNVDRFLSETSNGFARHAVCGEFCFQVASAGDLNLARVGDAYIDIDGDYSENGESDYHSPDAACNQDGAQDCTSGPASTIYYQVAGPSPGGYTYVDYWWFYRFNHFSSTLGHNHEGDWEGITVAPSRNDPDTFDFATFSQHGTWYSYLRATLRCDGGEPGSCGQAEDPQGTRVSVFPANGSHANYGSTCSEFVSGNCWQHTTPPLPERGHDGARPWGNNDDPSSLEKLPVPGSNAWVDWPGSWGDPGEGSRVSSPGNQQPHFGAPWQSVECAESGCATPSSRERQSARSISARLSLTPVAGVAATGSRARAFLPSSKYCANWFGGGVAAVLCDAQGLSRAVDHGFVDTSPQRVFAGRKAATGNGVAQAVGRPLRVGERLRVLSGLRPGRVLFVRAIAENQVVDVRFSSARPTGAGEVTVRRGAKRPFVEFRKLDGSRLQPDQVVRRRP